MPYCISRNLTADTATRGQVMSNPAFKFDHVHIISKDPEASAKWYVEMFGATIAANTMVRGAPSDLCRSRRNHNPYPRPAARRGPRCRQADPAIRGLFQP
jgi:hypothetical protein